ncbi:MAG: quinone-interacting membrane-bound oxidoreductase complex subunit QmoC [Rhodospirillales bacterium]|nr:quinone-interacting membrane-bound oxidoreductase complex subunit QmoC [Rhodospirillales bacterium]
MNQILAVQPDLEFKRTILGLDAGDLSACYQCGTCSVVCPISTDDDPFPRKEMVWTQWGQKERLMHDPAMWRCHQCQLCSTYCPREAKPANVMAALREYSVGFHAFPRFLGKWLSDPHYLPVLFGIPVVLLLFALALAGTLTDLPEGEILFRAFIPFLYVEVIFVIACAFALVAGIVGAVRFWRGAVKAMGDPGGAKVTSWEAVWAVVRDIFLHRDFNKCDDERVGDRPTHKTHMPTSHMAVFFGFGGLFITTTGLFIGIYWFDFFPPMSQTHPLKILGNVSGIAVIVAALVFIFRRVVDKEKAGKTTYTDWLFVTVLLLVAATGFLSQIARTADLPGLAYPTYFIHLTLVFFLLAYSPFSKFAHVFYRPTAMLIARYQEARHRMSG